ncbi:hypothetical protein PENSPDRAFT_215168 [Peniophora sp. CONT]|nr:hypothetical protein PENSPDRAFT_215168 [Peniophora sp. CONT]
MSDLNARLEAAARNYGEGKLASSGKPHISEAAKNLAARGAALERRSAGRSRETGLPAFSDLSLSPTPSSSTSGVSAGSASVDSDDMKRRMALDFLKQYKGELPPGMAEIFLDAVVSGKANSDDSEDEARAFMDRAQALVECKNFTAATTQFEKVITTLVGKEFSVPLRGGFISRKYLDLDEIERSMLMSSCAALGSAMFNASVISGRNDDVRSLSYSEEVETIHRHLSFSMNPHQHQWKNSNLPLTEYWEARMVAMINSSTLLKSLGNTSMAWHKLATIQSQFSNNFIFEKEDLEKLLPPGRVFLEMSTLKHPDPRLAAEAKVTSPDLQVLGSWEKLHVTGKGLPARQGDAYFVWNSCLYVLGGYKHPADGPFYSDFHYLDLEKLDGWHTLPSFPNKELAQRGLLSYHGMYVNENTLYYFAGFDTLYAFDLVKRKWWDRTVQALPGVKGSRWPTDEALRWFASTYAPRREHFYVFGGKHGDERLGCDLFLVINMRTGQWRQLSGNARAGEIRADYHVPGPRVNAMMWADADEKKIYLLGGEADRSGAFMNKQEHGASISYPYDDFWSWDIEGEFWTRERVSGNPPCPRSEVGYVFNPSLNSALIFGGYNPSLLSNIVDDNGRERTWEFQYFADTFMLDMGTRASPDDPLRWKQVLTRGFPTYRANSRLVTDPATGKTFLYGGYTSHEYLPFYKQARCFSDIWQLKVDVMNGFFEDVDVEEEARSAKAGPWQRCFTCGSTGRNWKRCGGSCNGRALFCGRDCQLEGWKEHKRVHQCRKK